MAVRKQLAPPRPLAPGDVVTAYSDLLEAWTAAQITDLHVAWDYVGVLELDWSGPEPASLSDLRGVLPLRLTHHDHRGQLSHTNLPWLLPRGCRVIGSMPLLHTGRPMSYGGFWSLGDQLAYQRRWDAGGRGGDLERRSLKLTQSDLDTAMAAADEPRRDVTRLFVADIEHLDGGRLVETFPDLTALTLLGTLGILERAGALNRLSTLRYVHIESLFGMSADDALRPDHVQHLELLSLRSIPGEYAAATRTLWRSQTAHGTALEVTGARKPEWVQENRNNPLRDWDGRELISPALFKKSVQQYRATRRELMAAVRDLPAEDLERELDRIGREYGEAFNRLSRRNDFIETEEREDLTVALDGIITEAEIAFDRDLTHQRDRVFEALDRVRDW